jgi:hypothetical protein
MAGGGERPEHGVAERHLLAVCERPVWEGDLRPCGEVGLGAGGRHEGWKPGEVVCLQMGLEHRHDR